MSSATRRRVGSRVVFISLKGVPYRVRNARRGVNAREQRNDFCRRYPELLRSGAFLAGVVTGTGANLELLISAGVGFDFDAAVPAKVLRTLGAIPDGVLVPDVVRDFLRNRINFTQIFRKECHPARLLCQGGQSTSCSALAL